MLDGVSLDQLRTFLAAADEGSFSAAGRRLRRALLANARAVAGDVDLLKARAKNFDGRCAIGVVG